MAAPGRVVVVGLGPGGADLILPAARAALEGAAQRFVRTERHPAVAELARDGIALEALDAHYDAADDLDAAYAAIVDTVIAAASSSPGAAAPVAYAVPGNPAVAERTVELLHDAARDGRIALTVVPGLSFADLAWARLGVDPMASGARVVDGRAPDAAALADGRPVLVAQCDHALTLSDLKLALLESRPPETRVTVLRGLGLPEEHVEEVALVDLDRAEADHLTTVWVPGGATSPDEGTGDAPAELARLLELAWTLRRPGGCPWDAEQSHHSLTRYLLEEAYEVVEAVERLPADAPAGTAPDDPAYVALVDELGDLLYQVIFHAVLAEEAGAFGMADVAAGIHEKLVRRHPHVFGDVDAGTSDAVMANWEQIKKAEKGTDSIVAGITPGLPSLLYAHKLLRKAASVGLDPGDVGASLGRIDDAVAALRAGGGRPGRQSPEEAELATPTNGGGVGDPETVLGELLAASVGLARALGVDTESALRGWAARFKERFETMERTAVTRGLDLHTMTPADVEVLWAELSPA